LFLQSTLHVTSDRSTVPFIWLHLHGDLMEKGERLYHKEIGRYEERIDAAVFGRPRREGDVYAQCERRSEIRRSILRIANSFLGMEKRSFPAARSLLRWHESHTGGVRQRRISKLTGRSFCVGKYHLAVSSFRSRTSACDCLTLYFHRDSETGFRSGRRAARDENPSELTDFLRLLI